MKKINNIGFILALILCILMLFAYCNRASASDVSIITGDVYDGDLTPDNPEFVQPDTPTNINTNVLLPENFGSNLPTNSTQNLNIFSSSMTFEKFNDVVNSNRMYYSQSILDSKSYSYYSVFYVLYNYNISLPKYTEIDVTVSDNFNTYLAKGFLFDEGQFNSLPSSYNFYNATTFDCQSVTPLGSDYDYNYAYLVIEMPVFPVFDDLKNNLLQNGYYIDNVIIKNDNVYFDSSMNFDLFLCHIFDLMFPNDNYIVPSKNEVFLSCINNIGGYNNHFDITDNIDYLLLSQVYAADEKICTVSDVKEYSFDFLTGDFLYTSFFTNSKSLNVDFLCFMNYNFYQQFPNEVVFIFDFLSNLKENFNFDILLGNVNPNSLGFNFYSVNYDINDKFTTNYGLLPYYSSFSFFTLMPSDSSDGYGNLSFDDINAAKYYIEPQSWSDFGAHFNNIVVWLCFEMPLLSNLTKPIYLFLNGFLEIWVQVALPLATAFGLIGGALIFYLIYLFISKLLFNKTPD